MGTTRKKHPAMAVPKLNQLRLTVDELVQRLQIRIGRNGLSERWIGSRRMCPRGNPCPGFYAVMAVSRSSLRRIIRLRSDAAPRPVGRRSSRQTAREMLAHRRAAHQQQKAENDPINEVKP